MSKISESFTARLGPLSLRSPLIAASGTVGSVVDFAAVGALEHYGAAVAKSVSPVPWEGNPAPRLGSSGTGMLNAIGIQNPGIVAWAEEIGPRLASAAVPVWGSAVGGSPAEFALVGAGLEEVGVAAVEVNLSCPNLEGDTMFALDSVAAAAAVTAVRQAVDVPVGAKLSPNAEDIVEVAAAVVDAGADWVVLTNTAWGFGIDIATRRPTLTRGVGGYSGPPLKALAMRCVWQVHQAMPDVPIVGCGGVATAEDVVEYLLAGAAAVAIGTAHFAVPRVGASIHRDLGRYLRRHRTSVRELSGGGIPW
ncbi:dihydroorotate dehydrogenase [Actinomycetota bacterium]